MSRPAHVTIDLQALRHNLKQIRLMAPKAKVLAMVKANAYGHGMITVAKTLQDVDGLGVASLEEGIVLRDAGIKTPIFLMEGLFHADELTLAALHNFTVIVHHEAQIKMLESAKLKKPLHCWIKINTGMNRLGVTPAHFKAVYEKLSQLTCVAKPIGVMTHFAESDNAESPATNAQIQLFKSLVDGLNVPLSLANSGGILSFPEAHADWVRPGLILYGASPITKQTGEMHGLKPVMTFSSRLIAVYPIERGQKVGYGGTWTASEPTTIGIAAVGYGDGYPQQAKSGTPVLVNGQQCVLAGRVSMDMLAIDLGSQSSAALNDEVVLWGAGLPVEIVANHALTSAYELFTRKTSRPKIKINA